MGFQKGHKSFRKVTSNKIIYQDAIKTVFLCESIKYGNKEVIIDTEDWEKVKHYRWHITYLLNKCYVYADKQENYKRTHLLLHRLIMKVNSTNIEIDHHFGNTLDNRKSELRLCTRKENSRNSQTRKNSFSGFKGVSWHAQNKKWRVRIQKKYIGCFDSKKEAAKAYNEKAKELFGIFACLNQVQENADANI